MTQPVDRERAALEAILDALLPQLSYYVHWTYRVTGTSDGPPVTISAKSQDPRVPDLARIVLRQGPDGGYATPANGSLISVGFLNADPTLPYVHSLDPTSTPIKSWQHALTLVELGNELARTLSHSLETVTIFTALSTNISTGNSISSTVWGMISTFIAGVSTYAQGIVAITEPGPPPHPKTDALVLACSNATTAITAYLSSLASASGAATAAVAANTPTLPTIIVTGT